MGPKGPDDQLMINRWLWDRPPIDPTILQQQQAAQAQQKRNQLAQAQQAVAQAALRRTAAVRDAQQNALQQQLLQQQQRMRQRRSLMLQYWYDLYARIPVMYWRLVEAQDLML
ncbi:hypothetical protein ANCCAN_18019 [Ancylostoma caninum]|uniref:Guanylate-binding protein/Atlastin C-terminal domain-containing protein n=1 Tax=Ancylostoma caninum TaxID=29170 RepID=A0A368FV80_ANCCA|nr:hypothetical protein ANCCAN_18019 [Ancylostoma caninum]